MIILGIDPGTLKTGIGIVEFKNGKCRPLDYSVIKTNSKNSLPIRILSLFEGIYEFSHKWQPDAVSIENIFVKENIRSALMLGHARGAAICAARQGVPDGKKIHFFEFSPREIKKALVGRGNATKDQVNMMIKILLNIQKDIPEDASDAFAAAICAAHNSINLIYRKERGRESLKTVSNIESELKKDILL